MTSKMSEKLLRSHLKNGEGSYASALRAIPMGWVLSTAAPPPAHETAIRLRVRAHSSHR